MMQKVAFWTILFFIGCNCITIAQESIIIEGIVEDEKGLPLTGAVIRQLTTEQFAISDTGGFFQLKLDTGTDALLEISFIGYRKDTIPFSLQKGNMLQIRHQLQPEIHQIREVVVENWVERTHALKRINLQSLDRLPLPSGNIETLLATMGASIRDEMSSRYSVRGGNYDENLVYINGIEIYRPMLMQSGQQEGLSCINTSMISSIAFSAGGFNAEYGDRMSSLLDITYRRPVKFAGSVMAGLLGASAHFEGASESKKFTHITGIRYKTNKYILTTLQTKGDYKPNFFDLQSCITYDFSGKVGISFLGNIALNRYRFVPQSRNTAFGTYSQTLNFTVYYDGEELDRFRTMLGALTVHLQPSKKTFIKLTGSVFSSRESVTYDILGSYQIDRIDHTMGSKVSQDSILNLGYGSSLHHARNYLDALISNLDLSGSYAWNRNNNLKWGIKVQFEDIDDRVREWEMIDSAGYSLPYHDQSLELYDATIATNQLISDRLTGYIQNVFNYETRAGVFYVNAGLRFHYWNISDQLLVSPRFRIIWDPKQNKNLSLHAAAGLYFQPPFYKELRDPEGVLHKDVKAQKSIHWLVGSEYDFRLWERPFRISFEVYYKQLENLIPYIIDDIELQYLPQYKAKGYTIGFEIKINGEFVKDAESWVSLAILRSREDRYNDSYASYRRPTDQLINLGMYFQDYLPNNPSYRVHLYVYYGSRLPYSSPDYDRPDEIFSMKAYKRVDIGLSKSIMTDRSGNRNNKMKGLEDLWFSFEIFNLFDFKNQASYQWIRTISNQEGIPNTFAIPNYLTGRLLNFKMTARF